MTLYKGDKILLNFKKSLYIFFLLALFLICLKEPCLAGPNLPFIDQSKVRVSIAAGKQGYGEIFVENPTEDERTMHLYLEDWYYLPGGDGSKEFMPAGTLPHSCASWINFSPAEFTLRPFGKQRISYSIKVPENASGGYYAALFFETQMGKFQEESVRAAGIDLKVRIATLFYVGVEGTVQRSAQINNLSLENDASSGGLLLGLDFVNTGNVDITAASSFYFMDQDGLAVARGEFNDIYTASNDKAKLTGSWKKPLAPGVYDLVITINLNKAQEQATGRKSPVITKETQVEIGQQGKVIAIGELK